ncbi:MAG: hypothetical protein M1827_002524 [Pycnora praestabilis]|nr:MAG: hypothetical protein M1827_002524 [Pycnora praestabilis]
MTSVPKRRLKQLNEHLVAPIEDPGTFETISKIRRIGPDSADQRVKGKVVIVTGTNSPSGIGRASAHQFAHNGARAIYICDFNDTYLPIHQRELQSLYPSVDIHARKFDAADEAAMKAVVDEAMEKYGRLDVCFANAGVVGMPKVFTDITGEEFMRTLRTNVLRFVDSCFSFGRVVVNPTMPPYSVFVATKYAAPAMAVTSSEKPYPSGSMIATASVAGLRSNAGSTDYSASKAAVISVMQTACYQLAGQNIRCNAICPGVVETGMTAPMYTAARSRGTEKKIGQLNPLQRGAVADEVARVALFLGSDEASYVNGQAWAVCGGLSAGHPAVPGKLA